MTKKATPYPFLKGKVVAPFVKIGYFLETKHFESSSFGPPFTSQRVMEEKV